MQPTRRQALGLGIGALTLGSRAWHGRDESLEQLAERLRAAPREKAFDVAADAIRGGATVQSLLGAVFLAGIQDVRPRPHGILHCVMMVESAYQLAEASPPEQAWLFALWNLHDLKVSQERDIAERGDWVLPPAPQVRFPNEAAARREFLAAMDAWDVARADRAICGLIPFHSHETLFEILWPIALRCYAFIGHKAIYVAQVERVLRRIGWSHAEPALRSIVMTLLVDEDIAAFERSREFVSRLSRWRASSHGWAERPVEMLPMLRTCDRDAAQDLVVTLAEEGDAEVAVWDGLRLFGAELFLRRPGLTAAAGRRALLPVHAVTVPNALGYVARTTQDETTRHLALLQAAAWSVALRDDLVEMVDLSLEGPGIDVLGEEHEARELSAVLERPNAALVRASLDQEPGRAEPYLAALRSSLSRRGVEHHQHKYAAAMAEEGGLADPRWRSRMLAAGVRYLADPDEPETEVHERSLGALRRAGVR